MSNSVYSPRIVELYNAQSNNARNQFRFEGKFLKEYDHLTKSFIHFLYFPGVSKLIIPPNLNTSLCNSNEILVMQLLLREHKSFSIDIQITDQTHTKRKIMFSTSFKENNVSDFQCKIPLHNYPINHWSNFIINLKQIVAHSFKEQIIKYVDHIIISANCKIRRIYLIKADDNNSDNYDISLFPKGFQLPLTVDVYYIKYNNILDGLQMFYENSSKDLIEIEKIDNKNIVKQNGGMKNVNVVNNQNNYLNQNNNNSKQTRAKSINKNNLKISGGFNNNKLIKENGIIQLMNSSGNKDNFVDNEISDNNNENDIMNSNSLKQRYEIMNKKTKNNLQFAKSIPSIDQISSKIKYEVNGRKNINYNKGNNNNTINFTKNKLNQSPKDNNKQQYINLHKQDQHINTDKHTQFNNFLLNGNDQQGNVETKQAKQISPVPPNRKKQQTNADKKKMINKETNINKVSDKSNVNNQQNSENLITNNKFSSALNYNINNSSTKQGKNTLLNDSIEEIYDYNETNINSNIIIDNPLLENGKKFIQIDKFNSNSIYQQQNPNENKQPHDIFDDLFHDDTQLSSIIINNNNRPFTPPLAQLVPIETDKNLSNEINDYKDLIYDDSKKCFYNPKTKAYYDIKH